MHFEERLSKRHREDLAILKPDSPLQTSERINLNTTFISYIMPPKLWDNVFLLCMPQPHSKL